MKLRFLRNNDQDSKFIPSASLHYCHAIMTANRVISKDIDDFPCMDLTKFFASRIVQGVEYRNVLPVNKYFPTIICVESS